MMSILFDLATRLRRLPRRERPPHDAPQRSKSEPFHLPRGRARRRVAARRWGPWAGRFHRCALEQCEQRVLLTFHLWKIDQVFSSADGKVQFIELHDPADGENHTAGHFISSNENKFTFPADLSTDATADKHFLIGTSSYAALPGAVKPDYIIPDNFFNPAGDAFDYADVDSFSFTAGQMPTDGSNSLIRDVNSGNLSTGKNSETNLAGQTASITVSAAAPSNKAPTLDPIADPAPLSPNAGQQTINLTGITAGQGETQNITITATSDNTALVPNPTVNYTSPNATGTLTYTPVAGAQGTANITVTVKDDGGTANGGVDTTVRTFKVQVAGVAAANLTITANGPPASQPGTPLTYTVTVTNSGGAAASGAIVTDTLPPGLTNITAVDTAGTVKVSGSVITDTLGSLAATTGAETLTITATPAASLNGTTVTNNATLTFSGATQTASAATTIGAGTPPQATMGTGFLTGAAGDGTPQTFVRNLYRELLGREPEAAGDSFWLSLLGQQNNAAGRARVIQGFLNSIEYKTHYITSVYQIFLGRSPDPGGMAFWTGKMGNPGTPGEHGGSADEKFVVSAILGSDEFFLKSGSSPQGWVNALYEDLFGRAADGAGLDFWAKEAASRGADDRDGIVRDLFGTPEAAHDLLDVFFPAVGGTAGHALAAAGTQAGAGSTELALLTGGGWENIYLEGPSGGAAQGNDGFFASLVGNGSWDDVQALMLGSDQFYNNPTA